MPFLGGFVCAHNVGVVYDLSWACLQAGGLIMLGGEIVRGCL